MNNSKHACTYYKLNDGKLIPKRKVDDAMAIIRSVLNGASIVDLDDSQIMSYGDKVDAVLLFRDKYDCSLLEAKSAIDFLRGEV